MISTNKTVALDKIGAVAHGFFGRQGGVSKGRYQSLNCGWGSDDQATAILENRTRVANCISVTPQNLLTVFQVHSADVVVVDTPWDRQKAPRADAMVTTRSGVALGILTADCAPVLFADKAGAVIGAAHAGWKGALGGVLENTISEMINQGTERKNIVAAVGPCISQAAYEVQDDFRARFLGHDARSGRFFVDGEKSGHWQFDLTAYVFHRLLDAGVDASIEAAECTYSTSDRFFSYRRTTHQGESDYGRQISVIALT